MYYKNLFRDRKNSIKIGMMSAWNHDSGVSIHAELIGREWVKMGHKLSVFSFLENNFHGTAIVGKDEDYIIRCFTTSQIEPTFLNVHPILETEYDVFITQDLGMFPQDKLINIFSLIKKHAKTVTVIHHNKLPSNPLFYQFDWNAVVCFDDRYYNFLSKSFPEVKLHIISYPCYPLIKKDKLKSRNELDLPKDKYILLIFGRRIEENMELLPVLESIGRHFPILLLVVSKNKLGLIESFKSKTLEILIRKETPNIEELYRYLHASDVLLYHRKAPIGAVVSSTAYQCLGSACPILALKSSYCYNMDGAVFTYTDIEDFKSNLMEIFNKGLKYRNWQKNLEGFLSKNSTTYIANQYIKLFQSLLEKKTYRDIRRVSQMNLSLVNPYNIKLGA